ncbi:hypothetical protein BDW02DRAFT_627751 [Decorospora gaudefroyi]|uniref:Uncharacterized protein n=1 Tax=Decorospora gaudefroyi TaxID=184978 RepID=A0A6A5KPP9_9PLEO|nr:hypothetical protein BDW02DRAFT_627751 [Decorospora gaudefroyi]
MAGRYALVAILNAAIASAQTSTEDDSATTSAYWTYTSRFVEQVTTSLYTYAYYSSVTTDTYTITREIKSDVVPTVTPTYVYSDYYYYSYDDLQIIEAYYPTGAVAETDLLPYYDLYAEETSTTSTSTTYTSIEFSMPVTMTAPASCPTVFTVSATASVDVPSQVTAQVSPTSVDTSSYTSTFDSTIFVYETWYLTPSAAPFTSTLDPTYYYYIESCSIPPEPYFTGSSSPGSRNGDDWDSSPATSCYYYSCDHPLYIWVIVIVTVIPGLFLLGFLESWFWFRRLMMGRSAMRFGTVCWILMSLWVLCFTRMQDRRSPEDRKLLVEKWKNMGSGAAFKAWIKWALRHKYPEELLGQYSRMTVGIVPPGQPLPGTMAQVAGGFQPDALGGGMMQPVPGAPGQVFYYGPPPPGWVQAPHGGFVPPPAYMYTPQQGGYYGNAIKDISRISQPPISPHGHPQQQQQTANVPPMPPQAPQPVYSAPQTGTHTPTPYGAPPNLGPHPAHRSPPSPPPQGPAPTPPQQAAAQGAPQIPPVRVSEAPAEEAPRPAPTAPAPPPPKDDPNDRSLYE